MTKNLDSRSTGTALIALGILFVVLRIAGFTLMSLLWPMWVLIPGILMLYAGFSGERAHEGWAVPGAIVGGTGAILFLLNLTGRWEAWAYIWALYPALIGYALHMVGKRNGDEDMEHDGMVAAKSGMYMLLGFGVFFELLIFGGFAFLDSIFLPFILIAAGIYMMYGKDRMNMRMSGFSSKRKNSDPVTGINSELRRQMDDAIYSDDDTEEKPKHDTSI